MPHEWVKSTLGHGEIMCRRCCITNREAAVLGLLNDCDSAEKVAEEDQEPIVEEPAP